MESILFDHFTIRNPKQLPKSCKVKQMLIHISRPRLWHGTPAPLGRGGGAIFGEVTRDRRGHNGGLQVGVIFLAKFGFAFHVDKVTYCFLVLGTKIGLFLAPCTCSKVRRQETSAKTMCRPGPWPGLAWPTFLWEPGQVELTCKQPGQLRSVVF